MPDTDIETERQVRRLEEQFKRLSITDSEGDLESGFVISRDVIEAVGACCLGDGSCHILSQRNCIAVGGMYQGDQSPCDPNPCATGTCVSADPITLTFLGEIKCCFVVGGITYYIYLSLDVTLSLPKVASDTWEISGPAGPEGSGFTTLKTYTTATCPDGINPDDFTLSDFAGTVRITFSGGIWTVQSWTVVSGINCYDFNGTSATLSVPNSNVDCSNPNPAFSGTATISC